MRRQHPCAPRFEPLEARILYSADLAAFTGAGAAPALVATADLASAQPLLQHLALIDVRSGAAAALQADLRLRAAEGQSTQVVPVTSLADVHAAIAQVGASRPLAHLHLALAADAWPDETQLDAQAEAVAGWSQALAPGADLTLHGTPTADAVLSLAQLSGAAPAASSLRHEVAFIDGGLDDAATLAALWRQAAADAGRWLDVVMLNPAQDGVAQVGAWLSGQREIAAVHLVSHGTAGQVRLGAVALDAHTLAGQAAALQAWQGALAAGADLTLYGCDVAASPEGLALMDRLREWTGADVAASTDRTAGTTRGGDWTLEASTGAVEAGWAADALALSAYQGQLLTYTVTSTADTNSTGTLRWAIGQANSQASSDTIQFAIAGTGTHTITLNSALQINETVTIDATTDDSFTVLGRPAIVLDGHGSVADGLRLYSGSSGSVVRGLIFQNFTDDAVDIVNSHGNTIAGNWVGLTSTGTGSAGSGTGVSLWNANNNLIGGSTAADRNVVSGNSLGIFVGTDNGTSSGNTIIGNWVGTNAAGSAVLGSSGDAIFVRDGADNTRIGGSASGEGNWVVGAGLINIEIDGSSSGTVIQGNRIGTDAAGTANWGSQENAILIDNGATDTLIGGTAAGAGNVIAFSGQGGAYTSGISVKGNATLNVTILGNSIYSNVGLGIDLGGDGVTANDAGDVDSGPNHRLNTLVLTSASTDGSTLTVTGSYSGQAGTYYRVELFSNTSAEASGTGEGRSYLGAVNMALPGGSLTSSWTLSTPVAAGSYITASVTRTDAGYTTFYETSEFSNHLQAVVPNQAPSGTDGSLTLAEDSSHTFSLADFGYSDPDGHALLRVWLDTLPASGQLLLNGSRLAAGSGVLAADISAGALTYLPAPDATGSTSFTFRVQDNAGTANGGSDTDATPNTFTIQLTAVNDAPTLGVGAANLVANGSFENGGTGWSSNAGLETTTAATAGWGLTAAADGATVAEVEGQASTGVASHVQQTIATTAGQRYVFSLQAVTRNDSNTGDMGALVVDGVEIARFSTGTDWRSFAASFTASGASTTIRIVSLGSQTGATGAGDAVGLVIDDVRVVADSGSAAYTEGAAPVVLAPQAVAADDDLAASSWNGASLTLARQGGADADDRFSASGTLGALVSGGSLVVDGVTIGSVTTNGGGSLVLVFDGNATSARVNAALRQMAYANASDAPPPSVTLAWALSDGNSGAQGAGGPLVVNASTTVSLTATPDAPVLSWAGGSTPYTENAGAVPVAPAATVGDADSADFDGGRLVVSISANGQAEDRLAIAHTGNGAGQIAVSGSIVSYGGVQIGTFSGGSDGSTPLVVSLNAQASVAAVQALARSVTYANVSDAPSTAARTISGTLEDGDGGTSNTASTTLAIAAVNDAPVITSSGTFTVAENTTAVGTVTSSDVDGGTPSYAITGGADAARFSIDASTGVLRFVTAPDHDVAGDADANNIYELTVSANDGAGGVTSQAVSVTVTNVNEAPSFVGTPSGTATEAQPYSVTISATDPDAGTVLAISATGLPAWLTLVDHGNGTATLSGTPGNGDTGSVNLMLQVSDGTLSATQPLTVTVAPVNDAPVITSSGTFTVAENTAAVGTVTSSDVDGGTPSYAITGGADAARFSIDAGTGVLRFVAAPDHEAAGDADANNVYELTVSANDGAGGVTSQAVSVTVTNVNEAPSFVGTPSGAATEAQPYSVTISATDPDAGAALAISATGLPAWLTLVDHGNGTATLSGTPGNGDAGSVNLMLQVSDGTLSATQPLTVTVAPANDAPVITSSGTFTVAENTTAVGTVTSSDVDGATPSYAITGGADAARFSIDASTGVLRFTSAPDFEAPLDSHRDAIYELQVGVADGQGGTAVQSVTVTVTDEDESPVVTDLTLAGDEDTAIVASLTTQLQDPEGAAARYTLATGPTHGTVSLAADGSFRYQPAADWSGDDRFTVIAQDGPWLLPIQVRLQVRPVDDAPQFQVDAGTPLAPSAVTPIDPAAWHLVDVDTATADLSLELRAVRGGWFELAARPGVAVSSFSAEALMRGELRFQRSGLEAPSFEVRVSDGSSASSWLAVTLSAAANPEPVTPGPAPAPTPASTPVIAAPPPGAMGVPAEPASPPAIAPATSATQAAVPAPAATPGAGALRSADAGRVPAAAAAPAGVPGFVAADGQVPATLRPNASASRAVDLQLPVSRDGLRSDPAALAGFDEWLEVLLAPAQVDGSSGWDRDGDGTDEAVADLEAVTDDPLLFRADLSALDLATLAGAVVLMTWALRAAGVLGGLALVAPAWRMVDPLPIIGADDPDDDLDAHDGDDGSEALATEVLAGGRR